MLPVTMTLKGFRIRKVIHLAGTSVPLFYLAASSGRQILISFLLAGAAAFFLLDSLRLSIKRVNSWFMDRYGYTLKDEERSGPVGSGLFFFSSGLTVLFFNKEVAVAALFFLAVGDAAAAILGTKWGVPRVKGKSLEGFAACLAVCFVLGIAFLPAHVALRGAAAAALAELLSTLIFIDDNLAMPLLAGLAMSLP